MPPIQVKVLLPLPKFFLLDYILPPNIEYQRGAFVKVPFRSKIITGIMWTISTDQVAQEKLRAIIERSTLPQITEPLLNFIERVANYNLAPLGNVLRMMMAVPEIFTSKRLIEYTPPPITQIILPNLSPAQTTIVDSIRSHLDCYSVTMLDGVTGSGKTEVYFSIIADLLLNTNAQILILLPEIILTTQLMQRFEQRFGFKPAIWHSDIKTKDKKAIWLGILQGKVRVVIGARSALFLPFQHLKLIVVDEEHEPSYKQEEQIIYHARDMAVLRGYIENIPVLLGSATPSIETIVNYQNNKYQHLTLPDRFGKAVLPEIAVVDMRKEQLERSQWISPTLRANLAENFAQKKQAILFLNRRGYAPLTLCRECGHRFACNSCSAWLVEHRKLEQLVCHHCGYQTPLPKLCPECNSKDSFIACGPGVERIAEEVATILPQARIALMTRDTINKEEDSRQLINDILDGNIDIIIGTQMVAKGHHFPNLLLVGIIDADLGLSGGDLRASERTYQLLNQVSGRAGREAEKGRVIIQSYNPENEVIKSLAALNRDHFITQELQSRKLFNMPPFSRLVAIIIAGTKEANVREYAYKLVQAAPPREHIEILGPTPAIIARLRDKYRYRILVKAPLTTNIQHFIEWWLNQLPPPANILVKLDVDPYSFL